MKGINSLRKATKAMELTASSQIASAMEKMQRSEEYFSIVFKNLTDMSDYVKNSNHVYIKTRDIKKTCIVLIGADRGFAGGYHSNLWKEARSVSKDKDVLYYPIGKKAREFVKKRNFKFVCPEEELTGSVGRLTIKDIKFMADIFAKQYREGIWDELIIIYTQFDTILQQTATNIKVMPIANRLVSQAEPGELISVLYEPSIEAVLESLVPQFIFGLLYGAITQAYASETAARKMAMDTANKNSEELIEKLKLYYNRVRQEEITQELSEIVGASRSRGGNSNNDE
jgi:F-type H+-transporting ATPase subunit gamma